MNKETQHIIIMGAGVVGTALAALLRPHVSHITLVDPDHLKHPTALALDSRIPGADVYFIAAGTPSSVDGSADTRQVKAAALAVAQHIEAMGCENTLVVNRATCPPGTADQLQELISGATSMRYSLLVMPEFLRQDFADHDTRFPHRIIIGASDDVAAERLRQLWQVVHSEACPPITCMSLRSAETIKLLANAMLATRVACINELTDWVKTQGGTPDDDYTKALGLDPRIGSIYTSPGYSGACLPKDVASLLSTTSFNQTPILQAVQRSNTARLNRSAMT